MDLGLHGKVVMVTGGAGRIGPVIGATFGREGAAVGVVDVSGHRATATATALCAAGYLAMGFEADVRTFRCRERPKPERNYREASSPPERCVTCGR